MASIWRLHTKTDGKNVAKYCIENKVIALGWSLCDLHIKDHDEESLIRKEREKIRTLDDYIKIIERYNIYGGKLDGNIKRLTTKMEQDDLIWLRNKGVFYLGRVTEKSLYSYKIDDFTLENDATNQLTNIDWYEIGDVSKVPGSLANKFIMGYTLQRIHDNSIGVFSKLKFNEKSGKEIYASINFDINKDSFFSLLSPEDVEDLLALWLYKKFEYITIPSTNKRSTQLYEYVMINPETGENIFTQVKQGDKDIDANNYKDLNGEVWLLTTKGTVQNEGVSAKIKVADPNVIKNFALSEDNYNLLPEKIKSWGRYYKNKR